MKTRLVLVAAAVGAFMMGGCSATPKIADLPDGTYLGQSEPETDGSYGTIEFTVESGKVVSASFLAKDKDGTPHDENYGLGSDGQPADATFYQRAQNAIAAEQQYIAQFEETSDQTQVDMIAGASVSYRMFQGAIRDALAQAQYS